MVIIIIISRDSAVSLCKEFIENELPSFEWFERVKSCVNAILLYGSVAKGTNNEGSDIDLLIFMPLKVEEEFTEGEYFYDFKGQEINIVIRSIEAFARPEDEEHLKNCHIFFQDKIFEEKFRKTTQHL